MNIMYVIQKWPCTVLCFHTAQAAVDTAAGLLNLVEEWYDVKSFGTCKHCAVESKNVPKVELVGFLSLALIQHM